MPTTGDDEATRVAYDEVAEDYARVLDGLLEANPWDRAVLCAFAETVRSDGGGPVLDAGCGTGRLTGHLVGLGLDVTGIDLSPEMIEVARRAHPEVTFAVGSLGALELPDDELAGAVAWYSLLHTPPDGQPAILRELRRVLRPGGHLALAFQVGTDEHVHLAHAYGHDLSLDVYRLSPDRVAADLEAAGLVVTAQVIRAPIDPEPQRQAYLVARKDLGGS